MLRMMVPAVAVMAAVMAATNPREDAHTKAMVRHAQAGCGDSKISQLVCGGATALASLGVAYDDHVLYSTARLGRTETVGAFGQVFVVSE